MQSKAWLVASLLTGLGAPVLAGACSGSDTVATLPPENGGVSPSSTSGDSASVNPGEPSDGNATSSANGPGSAFPPDSREAFCAGTGAPLSIPVQSGTTTQFACGGQVASQTFRYGLCTCTDANMQGILTTDAFNSNAGAFTPGAVTTGGSVGVNGAFNATGVLNV